MKKLLGSKGAWVIAAGGALASLVYMNFKIVPADSGQPDRSMASIQAAIGSPASVRPAPAPLNLGEFWTRQYKLINDDELFVSTETSVYEANFSSPKFASIKKWFDDVFNKVKIKRTAIDPNQYICLIDASASTNAVKAEMYVYLNGSDENRAKCTTRTTAFNTAQGLTQARMYFVPVTSLAQISAEKVYEMYEGSWRASWRNIVSKTHTIQYVDKTLDGYLMQAAIKEISTVATPTVIR